MGPTNRNILIKCFRHGNEQYEYFDRLSQEWEQSIKIINKIFQKWGQSIRIFDEIYQKLEQSIWIF